MTLYYSVRAPFAQVNSGMYASFAQYIGAIVLDEEAIARALADSIATAATAAQTKKPAKKASSSSNAFGSSGMGGGVNKNDMSGSEPILGKLLVMGNVTKKLVIMPDYPIGERHRSCSLSVVLFLFLFYLVKY
jgi:hypothetical protein